MNHYKLVFDEFSSNNQEAKKIYEGDFESFEAFMKVCEEFDSAGEINPKKYGLKVTKKIPKHFWGAGGFTSEESAFENDVRISTDRVNALIW